MSDIKPSIDESETVPEANIETLQVSEDKALDASYIVDSEETNKEATVFEKVKGFLFGKSKKDKTSRATVETSKKVVTPVEISSEPEVKAVKNLSKDEIIEEVAADVSTGQDVQEIAVSMIK